MSTWNKPRTGSVLILQDPSNFNAGKIGQPWEVMKAEESISSDSWLVYIRNHELGVDTWLYDWRFRDNKGLLCYSKECMFDG